LQALAEWTDCKDCLTHETARKLQQAVSYLETINQATDPPRPHTAIEEVFRNYSECGNAQLLDWLFIATVAKIRLCSIDEGKK